VLSSNFEVNEPPGLRKSLREEEARDCWSAFANRLAEVESVIPPDRSRVVIAFVGCDPIELISLPFPSLSLLL
jgi:hypothetical protein